MPGSPTSRKRRPRPANGVVEAGDELGQLALAADERARAGPAVGLRGRGEVERRVLAQDRLLELAQLAAGLDAELVDERAGAPPGRPRARPPGGPQR